MGIKDSAMSFAVKNAVKYARKDFNKNAPKILSLLEMADVKKVNRSTYAGLHKVLDDPDNNWMQFAKSIICDTDEKVLEKMIPPIMNVAINSYEVRMANIEKYGCNVPWAILMDPTAACNLKCTGCWAAEYGHTSSLSYDDLARIISQAKELGTYMFLYTGGEPTMRKDDLMRLCRENPDCVFMSFTNGTLIDDDFADRIAEVGNFFPAFSIEGYEEENDFRRGEGTFKKCTAAMQRLKDRGVPFGASLCYTSKNTDVLSSDEYMDWLIEKGVKFAWFFTYMPTGNGAVTDLMVSPEQRALMYKKMREWRETKPIFALDFWNDGEYVQGCIAGGRHYFHINSNGDCEPCAFVHYSNVNIKECSVLEALQSPLFMAYKRNQPFSNNMLRPCPVLDNPGAISKMVAETGAYSTEMQHPESANELFDKTIAAAKAWKVKADELFDRDEYIANHVKDENMYNYEKDDSEREFNEFEKTEA
ncbi:MAG: radical SAM protein [Eubacterium sp.]|nr:radical SAM protein [Eubacterium sp.]MBR2279272.1 radical SAM protein [Eubacterium sp.]